MFIMIKLRYNDTWCDLTIYNNHRFTERKVSNFISSSENSKSHEAVTDIENIYFPKKFFLHLPLESYLHSPC